MEQSRFWYDRDLIHALGNLSVTDHEFTVTENDLVNVEFTVSVDPVHAHRLIEERTEYLQTASSESVTTEDAISQLVNEIEKAIDVEYNTVGFSPAESGEYRRLNERQWAKTTDESVYDRYSDILYELTGEDIDYDKQCPSIPGLQKPFLEAVSESDDHELPPIGAVRQIIREHLSVLREQNQSRKAVSTLKNELENEGINPRSATRIAQNMDDLLITDRQLEKSD